MLLPLSREPAAPQAIGSSVHTPEGHAEGRAIPPAAGNHSLRFAEPGRWRLRNNSTEPAAAISRPNSVHIRCGSGTIPTRPRSNRSASQQVAIVALS